jgi:phage tail-like protein
MGKQSPFSLYNYQINLSIQFGPANTFGGFQEVSGLAHAYLKITGVHKVGDVTLKRGVVDTSSLWNWITQARGEESPIRHNATIVLRNEAGNPVQSWKLTNAKPRKYTGPALGGKGNDVAIEELILSAESIEIVPPH